MSVVWLWIGMMIGAGMAWLLMQNQLCPAVGL